MEKIEEMNEEIRDMHRTLERSHLPQFEVTEMEKTLSHLMDLLKALSLGTVASRMINETLPQTSFLLT